MICDLPGRFYKLANILLSRIPCLPNALCGYRLVHGLIIGIAGLLRGSADLCGSRFCGCSLTRSLNINPRAKALYERHGFRVEKKEEFAYLRSLLGFGGSETMVFNLKKDTNVYSE